MTGIEKIEMARYKGELEDDLRHMVRSTAASWAGVCQSWTKSKLVGWV